MNHAAKPLRADAARNRARLIEVATRTFAEEGGQVPIQEIARRAGVGAGTLYRHFPTKEALFEAIVADRLQQVIDRVQSRAAADPAEGLFVFLAHMTQQGAVDLGLQEALSGSGFDLATALPEVERTFTATIAGLLAAAQKAGTVRGDLEVVDVKTLIVGLQAMCRFRGGGDEVTERIVPLMRRCLSPEDAPLA
ncbi:TetR/AcrR family transcriptional regulator; helix-turn-helix transcriptional regulator [Streptomyces sp. GMY02]|uniref:TetR/AcrR family transcriptional regulator n=1 Tax=Streptomyces sp. GMY02 TaxID=1333528 RepID=UPI001C2C4307|nr:TetR/AcrR family transcriptional regulator [Streptomyces sp. GMY02]QXE33986.1 TetR/AcrR family transcriptional regulator; helix-turn-helix transcriptional regulator [Streptomyces sp. GMY02]